MFYHPRRGCCYVYTIDDNTIQKKRSFPPRWCCSTCGAVLISSHYLYLVIFQSLDWSQLEAQGVCQTFASILQICIDPRPKVRKEVLANPPTPLVWHPYAEQVAESLNHTLAEVNAGPLVKGKASTQVVAPGAESAIHALAFLNPIVGYLPPAVCFPFSSLHPILIVIYSRFLRSLITSLHYLT